MAHRFIFRKNRVAGLPPWQIMGKVARQKQLEEYRRLFYVALTRAENRLYIGGWETARNEGESAQESW